MVEFVHCLKICCAVPCCVVLCCREPEFACTMAHCNPHAISKGSDMVEFVPCPKICLAETPKMISAVFADDGTSIQVSLKIDSSETKMNCDRPCCFGVVAAPSIPPWGLHAPQCGTHFVFVFDALISTMCTVFPAL